ncbi:hypothetical protein ACFWIW_22000 [Amycolatopsis sp. NPDC058340]|uniref:hypothetical protein n=1 Tax=Amycolatopsis sp. NPDC058340 TaxID=3346453 RepID=UPI00366057F2
MAPVRREFADEHGWGINVTERTQRVLRMLPGMQDTPGATVRASDVLPMSSIRHPVLDVLAAAGRLPLHHHRRPPRHRLGRGTQGLSVSPGNVLDRVLYRYTH